MNDKIAAVERLSRLLSEGRLSDEEFENLKAQVLGEVGQPDSSLVHDSPPTVVPGTPSLAPVPDSQQGDWKHGAGLVLVVLGGLGVLGSLVRFSQEPVASVAVFIFGFGLNPLIWAGVVGLFLLRRPKSHSRSIGNAVRLSGRVIWISETPKEAWEGKLPKWKV